MADTAAHLVDNVLPEEPYRQWVLSVPWAVRFDFARDAKLLSKALKMFVEEVFRSYCHRAGMKFSRRACGAVTGIQRFGSSLNCNTHLHTVALDGVYGSDLRFQPLPAPSEEDLDEVLKRVRKRIRKLLEKTGCGSALSAGDDGSAACESEGACPERGPQARVEGEPETLDLFKAASIRGWVVSSEPPHPVVLVGKREDVTYEKEKKRFCAESEEGFSLHAGVRISSCDREGLEQLLRYVLRPAFAEERLKRLEDGRILYEFRKTRFDGASHVVLKPMELLEKLAALVPPPRAHLVHYSGIFAPNASGRRRVAREFVRERAAEVVDGERYHGCIEEGLESEGKAERARRRRRRRRDADDGEAREEEESRARRGGESRTDWATLMRRSFEVDVLSCRRCGGRMEILACITEGDTIRKILRAMGLWEDPPRVTPPRPRSPPALGAAFESDQSRKTY